MAKNRGKQFENVVRDCFEKVLDVSIDRVHDQTSGFRGSSNICDFVVYRKPYEYYIECKSVHGNTLSIHSKPKFGKDGKAHGFYGNITDTQWEGLLEKSHIRGVFAGVMCWWVDKDVTKFLPIQLLKYLRDLRGCKSIRYDFEPFDRRSIIVKSFDFIEVKGQKKRVFFDYDMEEFLCSMQS